MKRLLRVVTADEDVEDKRNINGKRSRFQGKFKLVAVVDVFVEIRRF